MTVDQPPIRIIHHWACSGGTVISRCIAALPNLVFLSEIHPYAYLRFHDPATTYAPTDLIRHLSGLSGCRDITLCAKAFEGSILAIHRELSTRGEALVLRSHSHVDFFVGAVSATTPAVSMLLSKHLPLLELLTVRHPLDSWLSFESHDWNHHFRFNDFEEYCRRCLSMLAACSPMPITKYEDFCLDPVACLAVISRHLDLPCDSNACERFHSVELTGGSGRGGESIAPLPRREIKPALLDELPQASSYQQLCASLGYDPDPLQSYPYAALGAARSAS
jgi:hypothetical protein